MGCGSDVSVGAVVGVTAGVSVICRRFACRLFPSDEMPAEEFAYTGAGIVMTSKAKSIDSDAKRGNAGFIVLPIIFTMPGPIPARRTDTPFR